MSEEKSKLNEEEFLKRCLELLNYFDVDYSKDVILLNSGHLSCIMNPTSRFYELFGGHSIWGVARYVAEKLGKKVEFENEDY